MIDFFMTGDAQIEGKVSGVAARIAQQLIPEMDKLNLELQSHIVGDKLSGQVLNIRTGNLARSILQIPAEQAGEVIEGSVSLGNTAEYGLAQEYGAHIPDRYPVNARALRWVGQDGSVVFAMHARAFDLPERSFMRSGFADLKDQIVAGLQAAAARVKA